MSRGLTAALETAIDAGEIKPAFLIFLDFPGDPQRISTLESNVSWSGETWNALGTILSIELPEESSALSANPCVITLKAPSDKIAEALDGGYQDEVIEVYFGCLDAADALIVSPYAIFTGLMNYIDIDKGPEVSLLTLYADGAETDLRKAKLRRYSTQDQQEEFTADKFFDYAPYTAVSNVYWGNDKKANSIPKHGE